MPAAPNTRLAITKGKLMRRLFVSIASVVVLGAMVVPAALAGNPHFVVVDVSQSGNTVTATGKEAGLGDEPQVHIVLSALAECINPGNNHPQGQQQGKRLCGG